MEKKKAKEKVKYVDKLDEEHKKPYLVKVAILNGFDPYDAAENVWSDDFAMLPQLDFPSLTMYLVCGVSAYTLQEFRAYKSLEAHMQFTDGWVQNLQFFSPQDCDKRVVKAKVEHSQRLGEKGLEPWAILDQSGDILTAHCDCMAGLDECCTHIGALLFKIEAVVRIRDRTTVTGVPAYWIIPSSIDKVRGKAGFRIDYTTAEPSKKKNIRQSN